MVRLRNNVDLIRRDVQVTEAWLVMSVMWMTGLQKAFKTLGERGPEKLIELTFEIYFPK